jgi:hypothetical protein
VLVVDNNLNDLIRMKVCLEECGYKVYDYQNSSMAIEETSKDSKGQTTLCFVISIYLSLTGLLLLHK